MGFRVELRPCKESSNPFVKVFTKGWEATRRPDSPSCCKEILINKPAHLFDSCGQKGLCRSVTLYSL